ncbi:MAG: hypothetical protein FJW30_21945 [Acidobacteria bacterium]|nr:hypothetical protein [Acidobacteriota bacterium]
MRALLLLCGCVVFGAKWNLAFHHDENDSSLLLRAIEFPSERRGVAIGVLTEPRGATGVVLVTSDGGKSWTTIRVKEEPLSLSCASDETCWFASLRGVWRSLEAGRDWKKISSTKGMTRIHFTSPSKGWAGGLAHSVWETNDGGKKWDLVPASKAIAANPERAVFSAMSFNGNIGIVGGNSRLPRLPSDEDDFPDWMRPDTASKRKELPAMMILLETKDGGKNWTSSTSSIFGMLTQVRIRPDGLGAGALLEYFNNFSVPSELIWVDFRTGKSLPVFKDKQVAVTDHLIEDGNRMTLAGVAVEGLRSLPVPQKIRFLEGTVGDAASVVWLTIPADYRAVARRVILGKSPAGRLWAVTDTGMILRLDR